MTINYTVSLINARLQDVINTIQAGSSPRGWLNLLSSSGAIMASVALATPPGTVSGGVLTFTTPVSAPLVSVGGGVAACNITDSDFNLVASGMTVGTSTASDVVMSTTTISSGQIVTLTYAAITGH